MGVSTNRRAAGSRQEALAAAFLKERGVEVLTCNYRCKLGEIDIIGRQDGSYLFIEVKYRRDGTSGRPEEAVGIRKQRTICRVADHYRMRYGLSEDVGCRFDIVAITGGHIRWIQNAFYYIS